ncbi:MAG: hypothetical protein QG670_744 [Thermoproteota archaeon]|nr:hypothetical protein [Thermoproteota archaeon]
MYDYDDVSARQSIVKIGEKHNLDSHLLAEAFISAYLDKASKCGNLAIQCRMVDHDSAIFLITNNSSIVSQFPIKLKTLKRVLAIK